MFYKLTMEDYVRVPPNLFELDTKVALLKRLSQHFEGHIDKEYGVVIDVDAITAVAQGVIIPGDGAVYYKTTFTLLVFKPEMQEVVLGKIRDIADFGAFLSMGTLDGMIHISQTMDDFVTFGKEKALLGKDSKQTLKVGDVCKAKIIAISFKEITNPRIGLTMRSKGLGKLEWLEEKAKEKAA
ncbi:MAG: DNA-directed RNA polymerase [Candidatus Woesearchaeota archaeon]